jgi:site-specific DNA-methyltransferase (adenine-specific)
MRAMPDNSVDLILTDPPYGLGNTSPAQVTETVAAWLAGDREYLPSGRGFMGKEWDAFVPPVAVWDEALRVLKPGGHVLAAAGSRTQDLMGLGMRLAGFEIRDSIAWLYGSGFPKSMDVSKAIDKAAGATRNVIGSTVTPYKVAGTAARSSSIAGSISGHFSKQVTDDGYRVTAITAPATDEAKQWAGWGTALKPAYEPFIMARKPLEGTVAANVLKHGTGALNIDASRIVAAPGDYEGKGWREEGSAEEAKRSASKDWRMKGIIPPANPAGRFPANVILDESQAAVLDAQSGWSKSPAIGSVTATKARKSSSMSGALSNQTPMSNGHGDSGGASRFFYVAKAPKSERPVVDGVAHPTVKPLTLMKYLAKLACPPGGVILDPFAGSGTTIEAALLEGFDVIGIEREADYIPLIESRIARVQGTDELAAAA